MRIELLAEYASKAAEMLFFGSDIFLHHVCTDWYKIFVIFCNVLSERGGDLYNNWYDQDTEPILFCICFVED
jgi:hypothetical protein